MEVRVRERLAQVVLMATRGDVNEGSGRIGKPQVFVFHRLERPRPVHHDPPHASSASLRFGGSPDTFCDESHPHPGWQTDQFARERHAAGTLSLFAARVVCAKRQGRVRAVAIVCRS